MHACMHRCIQACTHAYTTHTFVHARIHTCTHACIHVRMHGASATIVSAAILAPVTLGGLLHVLPGGRALMAAEALAANVTWLTEFLAGDIDASRRSEAEALLKTASKLTKQPSKTVLRQIAKELQVHQKDRRVNEIYDAALARVGDRVDELRKQSQERRSKRPRSEAVAVSGFPSNISDAQQFAGDDRNMSSATTGQDQPEIASGIGVSRDSDVDQFAARSVLKRERPDQVNLPAVESDAAQLAARSGADEIAVARGGGGSSSSGARPAKREKLITVNSGSVSSSDAAQLADIEAGRAWLTEQLTQKQVSWYKELLDMVPLLLQRPSGRDGVNQLRSMACKLACANRNNKASIESLHEACIQQWLARIRGLRSVGMYWTRRQSAR